jgi:hypothetical protein
MKTKALYLFALTSAILLSGCNRDNPKPSKTTVIKGKVVTFREDSLLYDGPVEVALYASTTFWPAYEIESKVIYPPYEYEFITDTIVQFESDFTVLLESDVPNHTTFNIADNEFGPRGSESVVNINLRPKTAIRYELINEDGASDKYISVVRIGGGQFQSHTTSVDFHLDEGWYNGEYPIRYFIVDKNTGNTESYHDTVQLQPFQTTNHTISF